MDRSQEADKETFLAQMLKTRPEYAIVWDVSGKDVQEFYKRVYVAQYVVIDSDTVYYSHSRHYANRAKALFADTVQHIVHVESEAQWEEVLPAGEQFKPITYFSQEMMDSPAEIALEDFIIKMLHSRPVYAVIWGITQTDLEYIVSRVYVTSFMFVIDDTLYYSYAKHFAHATMKRFAIPNLQRINVQNPVLD